MGGIDRADGNINLWKEMVFKPSFVLFWISITKCLATAENI
jgi:hypothetical protein